MYVFLIFTGCLGGLWGPQGKPKVKNTWKTVVFTMFFDIAIWYIAKYTVNITFLSIIWLVESMSAIAHSQIFCHIRLYSHIFSHIPPVIFCHILSYSLMAAVTLCPSLIRSEFISSQESPGAPRRGQELPGEPRSSKESPEAPRRAQDLPGEPRSSQESPGEPRRAQELLS